MLAGISTDYYLRLEQGRDRTPSVQVVEAIGRVLQLDPDEAAYLHTLARARPKRVPRRRPEKVPPGSSGCSRRSRCRRSSRTAT
jgi:transcriptional regulator with XRE-family HTH domain